jgi:hypothetical protein
MWLHHHGTSNYFRPRSMFCRCASRRARGRLPSRLYRSMFCADRMHESKEEIKGIALQRQFAQSEAIVDQIDGTLAMADR